MGLKNSKFNVGQEVWCVNEQTQEILHAKVVGFGLLGIEGFVNITIENPEPAEGSYRYEYTLNCPESGKTYFGVSENIIATTKKEALKLYQESVKDAEQWRGLIKQNELLKQIKKNVQK